MLIAIYAAFAMLVQDILYVLLTQAEARNRPVLAGTLDSVAYLAQLATTVVAVSTLQGHDLHGKLQVIFALTAANFLGSYTGVKIGKKFVKEADDGQGKTPGSA